MNLFGKFSYDLLPALTFGSRYPCVMKSSGIDSHEGQKLLQHFETTARVQVTHCIMTIFRMAAGDEYAVYAVNKRFGDEQGVHASRARNPNDSQVRGLFETANTSRIGATVGTPVT